MTEVRYSAEGNNFAEPVVTGKPVQRAFKGAKVSKTPRTSRAEREDSHAEAAQRWRVADAMRKAAAGDYVVNGFSYFTKQAVEELNDMGLRFATDKDKSSERMYMENVDGHLREVKVCAIEKPKVLAANDANADPLQRPLRAGAGTPVGQVESPARATNAPRPSATAPVARPV